MKHNIHPCIWYDGNAKAAAKDIGYDATGRNTNNN